MEEELGQALIDLKDDLEDFIEDEVEEVRGTECATLNTCMMTSHLTDKVFVHSYMIDSPFVLVYLRAGG